MAVIKAVDDYADLMRISVASAGNDHRLGANEAPPAIVSIFLGEELNGIIEAIEKDEIFNQQDRVRMETGATVLPHFFRDTTDRNRTSPFAFTGNKFEFRMLGSEISVAGPNIVLNTAVAEALSQFYEELKDANTDDIKTAVHQLVKRAIAKHKKVIFNGNGYTDEWIEEAEKRGLYNLKSTPEALPHFVDEKNISLFTKHGVFTETEMKSRYEILVENYCKTIHIEAKTLQSMLSHDFLPALYSYEDELSNTINVKKEAAGIESKSGKAELQAMSDAYDKIYELLTKFKEDTKSAELMAEEDVYKASFYYHDVILSEMDEIRKVADEVEDSIPTHLLPYPTYEELLFNV